VVWSWPRFPSIGRSTNNEAEYKAMIAALQKALKLGADEIELRSDSELVSSLERPLQIKSPGLIRCIRMSAA